MQISPRKVYLDNSATTRVAPEVLQTMLPYFTEMFGNASSTHQWGQRAKQAMEEARHQVAQLINATATEIVFTSGGTEADNLAIKGIAEAHATKGKHIITSQFEHPAVLNSCKHLESLGWNVTYLPVYREGLVRLADVAAALTNETVLISVMQVNNELGTIQPIKQIGDLVKERRAAGHKHLHLHTDAVQSVGKILVDVRELGVDLLSISGHKIHAPKGIGALFVRRGVRLQPQSHGGHHERDRRAGTESVPLVVALGKACELERLHLQEFVTRVGAMRDGLETKIISHIPNVSRNGDTECRVPHISNFNFDHCEGEGLMIALDLKGIAVSTGSACASGSIEPSHVLTAIGLDHETGRGTLRFSLGRETTPEELEYVLETLPVIVEKLRRISPKAGVRSQVLGVS